MSLRAALALSLAGTALAVLAPAASTAEAAEAAERVTDITLTVSYPRGATSGSRSVELTCDPAGGTHPRAGAACAQLDRNNGRFTQDPASIVCPMVYAPVRAEAVGYWRDRPVSFDQTYGNDCFLRANTGSLFDF